MFYCGYCRVGGGIVELDEFAAQRKESAGGQFTPAPSGSSSSIEPNRTFRVKLAQPLHERVRS